MTIKTKYHRDGSITYWSIFRQEWVVCSCMELLPDEELASMNEGERVRVIKHLSHALDDSTADRQYTTEE